MSAIAVHAIFDQIKQLSSDDRSLLDQLLTQLESFEWQREAERARKLAEARGLDQSRIDNAVASVRYGS